MTSAQLSIVLDIAFIAVVFVILRWGPRYEPFWATAQANPANLLTNQMSGTTRLVVTILAGVITYALVLVVLSEALATADDSLWYWLPFGASVTAVVLVSAPWKSWPTANRGATIATVFLLILLVLAIDLAGAIWYSCSKGVCL